VAVVDVLVGPVVERRPRADGGERADDPPAVAPRRGVVAVGGGERLGLAGVQQFPANSATAGGASAS